MEAINQVNDNLILTQRTTGLTFGTDALLLAAYIRRGEKSRALELGGGTGIISLLLLTRNKVKEVECVEIQEPYAALIRKNAEENHLSDRLTVSCCDIRDTDTYGSGDFDIVFSNPPYMKNDSPACLSDEKQIARHEVHGGIYDFVLAAKKKLKWGGRFFCVYRTDRLLDLLSSMRECGIEPKRMTYVHASLALPPSMVLVEGKRGGKGGLIVTKPLLIGNTVEERKDSPDMMYILTEGRFPPNYD